MCGAPTPRQHIFDQWRATAPPLRLPWNTTVPPLEPLRIVSPTKSGEEEIVGQLYNFVDKGRDAPVSLRPEMTPTFGAHGCPAHERNYKKPIKWFALPQLFRYERQQKRPFARETFSVQTPTLSAETEFRRRMRS